MSKPKIVFIVDKSGSMRDKLPVVNHGLQKLLDDPDLNNKADLFGVSFGSQVGGVETLPGFFRQHQDWGGTALYEAVVKTLDGMHKVGATAAVPTLVMMITDGQNNEGRTTVEDAATAVEHAEDIFNWDFLFVGTDMDAYKVGDEMHVKPGKTLSFTNSRDGFKAVMDSLHRITGDWVNGHLSHDGDFFTEADRAAHATTTRASNKITI